MKQRSKVIDWKFWLSLTLAICVAYLSFVGYAAVQDGREKSRQINALIRTSEEKDAVAERREQAAIRDRAAADETRQALIAYIRALAARQADVLAYLRTNGIELPVQLVREIPAPAALNQATPKLRNARPREHRAKRIDRPGHSKQAPGQKKKRSGR